MKFKSILRILKTCDKIYMKLLLKLCGTKETRFNSHEVSIAITAIGYIFPPSEFTQK